jgi:TRAP-type C4-dicarboxylate transport system substrate-binding protein
MSATFFVARSHRGELPTLSRGETDDGRVALFVRFTATDDGGFHHITMDKDRQRRTICYQTRTRPGEDAMSTTLRTALVVGAIAAVSATIPSARAQDAVTLHGAVQFNDDHAFNKALLRFEALVKQYYGKPINFVLHRNSELGLEKDYFAYMNQGISVDYAIVSPAHMSTFSKTAPFIDAPFLLRDLDHWNKVLDADLLKPIADEIAQKADVMLIGYAGGGVRNIFANRPVRNLAEMKGLKVRVQGAPIWSRTFTAAGMSPTVIAYNEIYNAIQNGVIAAGENEAAGVEQMKFYEVGPNLAMTEHAITIRPICFSGKTFKKLSPDLQAAIIRAGKEAGGHGRQIESSEDSAKLDALEKAGKLKRIAFTDRAEMKKLVDPVMTAYAKEIGADAIFTQISAIK